MSQRELNLEQLRQGQPWRGHLWSLEDGYSPFLKSATLNTYFASVRYLDIETQNSIFEVLCLVSREGYLDGNTLKGDLENVLNVTQRVSFQTLAPTWEYQGAQHDAGDRWANKTGLTFRDFPAWGRNA